MSAELDSLEGNIANALQIAMFAEGRVGGAGWALGGVLLTRPEFDAIEIRLNAALSQARGSGAACITPAGVRALAEDKIEQFSIRPLPSFPCPSID